MARHFTVTLTSGTNVGPYEIYYTSISPSNKALLYGTLDNAENLSLAEVQAGVLVTIPDDANSVILYNTNANVISDCPTNFVEYPLTADPTSTPLPSATPGSTPNPTNSPTPSATAGSTPLPTNSPTPSATAGTTPLPTNSPTPSPSPSASPTQLPTETPIPTSTPLPTPDPTATGLPSGNCQFVFVSNEVMTSGYGLRYNLGGQVDTLFENIFATANVTYNGLTGSVYSVCSTLAPLYWEQSSNSTLIYPYGVYLLESGGECTQNIDCVYSAPDKGTPDPTPFPTATATAVPVECYEWSYDDSGSMGDPNGYVNYIDCDGTPETHTFAPGSYGLLCARSIASTSVNVNVTNEGFGDCGSGSVPSPTSTPFPTATTREVILNSFYISTARLDANDFCTTNYTTSTLVKIDSSTISGTLGKQVYESDGITPYSGISGRFYFISTTLGAESQFTEPKYYVGIPFNGIVDDVGQINCGDGGLRPV